MAFVAYIAAVATIHAQSPAREITMIIAADDIVSISRSKEIPRSEFDPAVSGDYYYAPLIWNKDKEGYQMKTEERTYGKQRK
jgi:hypothetical protein